MLYDRGKIFDTVASLVGLDMHEERRLTVGHRGDPPIMVIGGSRGAGKTAVLTAISRAYGNRVPRVLLDLAGRRYSEEYGDPGSGSSPLLRMLQDLQWELEMKVRGNSRLQFPRLSLALLAIATWQPDEEITLAQANKRLAEAGDNVAKIARISASERGEWVDDWISEVVSELAVVAGLPFPVDVVIKASIRVFTSKVLKRATRKAALTWHQDFDPIMPGDGYEALITVSRDFHLGGNYRARAEVALVAALLADVSSECGGLARLGRAGFPLALLDNVHAHPAGARLLELVLGCRAQPRPDPLVIVVTGPADLAARLAALIPDDEPAGTLLAQAELTRLDQHVALRMLNGADPRQLPPDLAQLICRLAGGLPLGLDAITRAIALAAPAGGRHPAGPPLDGSTILAIPAQPTEHGGPWSVTECLLAQLLPDPAWRSRLITLAAARDFSAAQALVAAHLTTDQDRLAAAGAWLLLRENGWEAGEPDPEHFVGDPFLRTLLLEELRDRTISPTSADVHATLRDLYLGAASGPLRPAEPARLFHCLALGDCPHVVRRFRDAFGAQDADAGSWVAALRTVVSAPHSGYPDHRRDTALGAADRAGHDEVHRSVNRLLHAAWYLTDPLVAPDQEVADKIAAELNLLAQKSPGGHQVLSEAGVSWRRQLLGWQQGAPHPVRAK